MLDLFNKKQIEKKYSNTLRIRQIEFKKHYFFKDLTIDFTDENSDTVDTIIIAGENGTGKTTILNEIYKTMSEGVGNQSEKVILTLQKHNDIEQFPVLFPSNQAHSLIHNDRAKESFKISFPDYKIDFDDIKVIYSTTDINFKADEIRNITSKSLDKKIYNQKTDIYSSTELQQILIDIYTQDNLELGELCNRYNGKIPEAEFKQMSNRIIRFTKAFNSMFDDLKFKTIKNENGRKKIVFERNGKEIDINDLSSGEKQIVYRGAFLLMDKNSLYGAVVLIDEPEISLHPTWQSKIVDYYKQIFTDENNNQTSQLIIVTHSPFIIHGENRYNDKIIVLKKEDNKIIVTDNATFPSWNNNTAIKQAFNINLVPMGKNIVFLEGITDKLYFQKALEVFEYKDIKFIFDIPGEYIGDKDIDNGKSGLDTAYKVLKYRHNTQKYIFLYDVDVTKNEENKNGCYIVKMKQYNNTKNISKGIENLLIIPDNINMKDFHNIKEKNNGYGVINQNYELDKKKLCNYICDLNKEQLKEILKNLKTEIDRINEIIDN